jgi:MoxR-like ATPase
MQLPPAKPGLRSFADRLKRLREAGQETEKPAADSLAPDREFVGRDKAFYELETALTWQRVAVVYGPAGMGKTELAKAFGRWWQLSGGVDDPRLV